jgi:hypothetical protein
MIGVTPARESGGTLDSQWRHQGTPVILWFLTYGVPNRIPFLPTTPHRQEELVLLTFRWQQSAGTWGDRDFFIATLASVEELLQ